MVEAAGPGREEALERVGITVNKNTIPYDPQKPMITSGVRLGTPALTTRGMQEPEMRQIAAWIARVIDRIADESVPPLVKREVYALTRRFPLPQFKL